MEQRFGVDVDGLGVLHRVGVEAADGAARVRLLQELQALVQVILQQEENNEINFFDLPRQRGAEMPDNRQLFVVINVVKSSAMNKPKRRLGLPHI